MTTALETGRGGQKLTSKVGGTLETGETEQKLEDKGEGG
ncbi:hypothetical protein L248_1588 [Schleiferilactobacillus shenzhenensis LY-73]|uniref:Uncharacterized protein n=1 Tax=Schleiferilactobacillus shenzhenensis LY-73 TaxID=1231336 RepID=U4TH68_9LACO|nr:hypothetical protein L248_1588 [Schleiferilactobacillus shenzhenensis LY-73]